MLQEMEMGRSVGSARSAYNPTSIVNVRSSMAFGWGTWIRTTTNRVRVCRPTVRRFPSAEVSCFL